MGWIRTIHDGERWLWVRATEAEEAEAAIKGLPVHVCFGEQPETPKTNQLLIKQELA